MKRIFAALLALATGLFAFSGCKESDAPKGGSSQPTQMQPVGGAGNPLTSLLVAQTDERDALLGAIAQLLDAYEPGEDGPDYSGLTATVLTPFSEADGPLSDVLLLSFYLSANPDGSYSYAKEGEYAQLTVSGQYMAYSGKQQSEDEGAYQRQSAVFTSDGSQMTVEVFQKEQNADEIRTLYLQWIREGEATRVQCCYTTNGGETTNAIRYLTQGNSMTFAIYEGIEQCEDLFSIAVGELIPPGYITHAVYAEGIVTIQNQSHTLVVGP